MEFIDMGSPETGVAYLLMAAFLIKRPKTIRELNRLFKTPWFKKRKR